jgi:hypothetical protein
MQVQPLRDLLVASHRHPRGQPHVSAASGLARVGRRLYLAVDDEHHLGRVDLDSDQPVHLLRVVAGDLPADAAERKRRKPDFEAVCLLPPHSGHPHGALLVLGSGSRPQRQHVLRVPLDAAGEACGAVQAREIAPLLEPLRQRFADLNLEGAFVQGDQLCLLQRGHLGDPRSARIRLSLPAFLAWMDGENAALPSPQGVDEYLLDSVEGVPLAFTDGAALPEGGWLFSAVAERTADSYADGPCLASAVGCVDGGGRLAWLEPLQGSPKVEGLAVDGERLLLVTDDDDPAMPSRLLAAEGWRRQEPDF